MADSLLSVLERLNLRIKDLVVQNSQLKARNTELEQQNRDLEQAAREAKAAQEQAELDVEYLKVSHKLADDPDTLISTRRHVAQLIRNIDRCLEMLKE